eukprot:3580344-Prymnesium_polylepis.3
MRRTPVCRRWSGVHDRESARTGLRSKAGFSCRRSDVYNSSTWFAGAVHEEQSRQSLRRSSTLRYLHRRSEAQSSAQLNQADDPFIRPRALLFRT